MNNRILTVLAAVLLLIRWAAPASAQQGVGSWETVSTYGGKPTRLIDTPKRVFVLAQNRLSAYDKESGEVLAYSRDNWLNDGKIADIFYNFEKKFLMVSYQSDNIDVIFDNGRVVNFSELMNAGLSDSKTINDVAFRGDKIYVAGNFGLMVLDVAKGIVVETGLYGCPVYSVTTTPTRLFIGVRNPGKSTWWAPMDGSHSRFSAFTQCWADCAYSMEALSETEILCSGYHGGILLFNPDNSSVKWQELKKETLNGRIQHTATGYMLHDAACQSMLFVDKEGGVIADVPLPESAPGEAFGCYAADPAELWLAGPDGYGLYDLENQQFSIQRMRPQGTSGPNVGHIVPAADGSIYLMTTGEANENSLAYRGTVYINRLNPDGSFDDLTPEPDITYGYKFDVNPADPRFLALASRFGIYRLDSEDCSAIRYDETNSPVTAGITPMMTDTKFDSKGNVWFLMNWEKDGADNLYYIPAEAWKRGPEASDIVALDFGTEATCHSSSLLVHSSGLVIFTGAFFIGAYDNGGTPTDPSDDRYVICRQTTDEDGMSLDGRYVFDMAEDSNGRVWLATLSGVRVIRDPKRMFDSGWTIARPKVARNDGTNLADFLLNGEVVTDVSIDGNGHKWFSTIGSGIYRTNADGNEILDHFTVANSGLISNIVYGIHADRSSNCVYIGTDEGLCIYRSTTGPAAPSYSDVYAYPNPVTPDFSGLITITGLMDKSLVKIADSAGNVFHQAVSEGGMVTWDGCDSSGSRVKSGVYYVFASQNSDGSSAAVTKILVIN